MIDWLIDWLIITIPRDPTMEGGDCEKVTAHYLLNELHEALEIPNGIVFPTIGSMKYWKFETNKSWKNNNNN